MLFLAPINFVLEILELHGVLFWEGDYLVFLGTLRITLLPTLFLMKTIKTDKLSLFPVE